jgi:hypothetical protein
MTNVLSGEPVVSCVPFGSYARHETALTLAHDTRTLVPAAVGFGVAFICTEIGVDVPFGFGVTGFGRVPGVVGVIGCGCWSR